MIHDKNVIKNRNNLIQMMALSEDIVRNSQSVYSFISNAMNNPEDSSNIKPLIEELHKKVIELKKFNIRLPLIEEEIIELPDPKNASIDDPDYIELKKQPPTLTQINTPPEVVKTYETDETPELQKTRETRVDREKRVPKKNPRKPLNNKKNLPSPDIDSI